MHEKFLPRRALVHNNIVRSFLKLELWSRLAVSKKINKSNIKIKRSRVTMNKISF